MKAPFVNPKPPHVPLVETANPAQAVNHVHKHGYFHRDMKPENLLVPRSQITGRKGAGRGLLGFKGKKCGYSVLLKRIWEGCIWWICIRFSAYT